MATTDFPVNPELAAVAIGYKNRDVDLIADVVCPRVVKTGKKFAYTKYSAVDGYTVPPTRVGAKSEPNVVSTSGLLVNDECVDFGLDDIVPNDEVAAWEAMMNKGASVNPLIKSTSFTTGLIVLDREIRVANLIFNAANYTYNTTLSGTSQWSDYINSNPLSDILTQLDTPLVRPNTLVFGQTVWTKLRQHPKLVQAVFGTAQTGGVVTAEAAAKVFEVKQIVVGAGFYNTARRGQAATMTRIWGKSAAALFISEQLADADQPTFAFTAEFGTRIAGDIPEPKMGLRGSTRVRVGESVKEVLPAPDAGFFWQSAIA